MLFVAAPAGAAPEREAAKPRLLLARGAPLVLRGVHFIPEERVRVTVRTERRLSKTVTAGATGTFVVRFATSYDRCLGLAAVGVGDRGSRARLNTPDLLCPPRL